MAAETQSGEVRFADARQERIHRRLLLVGNGPACFFVDACHIMSSPQSFGAATHLVSHSLREIESGLRDVLEPLAVTEKKERSGPGGDKHRPEVVAILRALGLSEGDAISQKWLGLIGRDNAYGLHARAHRNSLASPRKVDEDFLRFWNDIQEVLNQVLERYESRYLETIKVLDRLLAKANPTTGDVDSLKNHVPNTPVCRGYFFRQLTHLRWLPLLLGEGFFRTPPEAIRDPVNQTVSFPYWPESQFLARVAKDDPQGVLAVALEIETENPLVHSDLVNAALLLPGEMSARLAEREALWVEQRSDLHFGSALDLGKLVSHLAKESQAKAALSLAATLLAVLPDTSTPEQRHINEAFSKPLEPRIRMDAWEYGEILKKHVPDLLEAAPDKTFTLLCDLLEKAVEYSTKPERRDAKEDLSFIWHPAIEEHEQNMKYDQPQDSLVDAVRDTGEKLVSEDTVQLPVMVDGLEGRGWTVFKRIALHLLRVFPDKAGNLVAARLTNHDYYETSELRHEYTLLSRDCFGRLQAEQKQVILGWIDAIAVDAEEEREAHRRFMGSEPPPETIHPDRTAKIRKLQRLQPIRDSLPDDWKAKYDQWVRDVGHEPEHPEFVSYHSSWTGPTSPKSSADLKQMTADQVVRYLKEWKAPGGHRDPSPEGLGRSLTEAVAAEPVKFAAVANLFKEVDPIYVSGFMSGLREVVANHKQALPWENVLSLCEWVVAQPREIPGRKSDYDSDTGWGWSRNAIAGLLDLGMTEGVAEIPFSCRETVWRTIEPITDDPDPTVEAEARYGGDPLTYSINTTRGHAMYAAVGFGIWVRRHLEKTGQAWRGLDEIPSLRKVLNAHLEPQEHSLAIRSVYGRRFSWLGRIDQAWLHENVERIFPLSNDKRGHFNAAWDAYVVSNWPTKDGFKVLDKAYRLAIRELSEPNEERRKFSDPNQWLAFHMMLVYGRGEIELDHNLLGEFFEKAPDAVRAEAMAFVGRSLKEQPQQESEAIRRLFVKLWERRLAHAQQGGRVDQCEAELAAFGWWFASGKFENDWAMAQLIAVLRLVNKAAPDRLVMDRLVETAAPMPEQTVECLGLMIEGNQDYWKFHSWRDEIRKILRTAIQSGNLTARDKAIELVNRLGAMGHIEYRDLLTSTGIARESTQ